MGIIKKIIGLFILVIIVLLVVNLPSVVSSMSNIALGPVKSPVQLGSLYATYGSSLNGIFVIQNAQGVNRAFGNITVTQVENVVSVVTENIVTPQGSWNLWLADTPTISNQTNYIDFGAMTKTFDYKTHSVKVPENININTYKYAMIVNPADYTVFAISALKK